MPKNKIGNASYLEEVQTNKELYPFPSMINFRSLVGNVNVGKEDAKKEPVGIDQKKSFVRVYRSSRPDYLTEEEMEPFLDIDINGIIDLRAYTEYKKSHNKKLIDSYYDLYKVRVPIFRKYKAGEAIKLSHIKRAVRSPNPTKKHYLIDFFGLNYLWMIATRLPKPLRFLAIFYVPFDILIMNKNFFVGLLSKKKHMLQTYTDIIQRCGSPICAGLKLLCDPDNLPAIINCAYGKDRTGIVSALLLSCLGYSREYICNDYAQSLVRKKVKVQMEPLFSKEEKEQIRKFNLQNNFHHANYRVMELMLQFIDEKYGGVSSYLESIGFFFEDQQKLRQNLLD